MAPDKFEQIRAYPDATKFLKDALALEKEPEVFTVATIPEGTENRIGGVSEHPEWGCGGEKQFEIVGRHKKAWFSEPERIKQ